MMLHFLIICLPVGTACVVQFPCATFGRCSLICASFPSSCAGGKCEFVTSGAKQAEEIHIVETIECCWRHEIELDRGAWFRSFTSTQALGTAFICASFLTQVPCLPYGVRLSSSLVHNDLSYDATTASLVNRKWHFFKYSNFQVKL